MYKIQHNNFKVIKTFNDVQLTDKPLVICDIDNTFICTDYSNGNDYESRLMSYSNTRFKQTDPVGFNTMIQTIERLGGKLVFLTARNIISHPKTINDLKTAGLETPEKYDIHYTNSEMTKGEYLKKTNLTYGYQDVSFIDDYPSFVASVKQLFPHIKCYLFSF